MQLRPLGRSGLSVSNLCLGGNVFGWTADEASSHALLNHYAEAGGNFIDTANVYSLWVPGHVGGESETVIGRWLRASGRRDRMIVATKVGMDMPGLGKGPDARADRARRGGFIAPPAGRAHRSVLRPRG
jgi:aryl-alcohol dehydrogenase-like predicted oxidoreductase